MDQTGQDEVIIVIGSEFIALSSQWSVIRFKQMLNELKVNIAQSFSYSNSINGKSMMLNSTGI